MSFKWTCVSIFLLIAACETAPDPEADTKRATPQVVPRDKAVEGLSLFADRLISLGNVIGDQEDQLLAVFQHLPVAEGLEFRDASDLAEFVDGVDLLVGALVEKVRAGGLSKNGELALPIDAVCSLTDLPVSDPLFQQCATKLKAVNARVFIATDAKGFVIAPRFGKSAQPVLFRVSQSALEIEIDLSAGRELIDLLLVLLEIDLGQRKVEDLVEIGGKLTARVAFVGDGLSLTVALKEAIHFEVATGALVLLKPRPGNSNLLKLEVGIEPKLEVAVGTVELVVPQSAIAVPLGLDRFGRLDWAGVSYSATPGPDNNLAFRTEIGDFRLVENKAGTGQVLLGFRVLSGPIFGTADGTMRKSRFDLRKGFQTTYESAVRLRVTKLGLEAEHRIAPGTQVIDFRRSTLAKTAARLKLAFQGELTKIDELLCTVSGTSEIELLDASRTVLTAAADDDDDDDCLVGYFTKENGEARYHYQRQ